MKPEQSPANDRWMTYVYLITYSLIIFGLKLRLIDGFGNATPFWDQWDAEAADLYIPYLEGTYHWIDLFSPHNEHRILTTRLLSLFLLIVNDLWNPLLQMTVNAILHIVGIVLCNVFLSRVIGYRYLPVMLAFSLVLFGIPYGWENTLVGFQSQFYFVILFSIVCIWSTVTQEPLSVKWWGGIASGILAFLSLASGIFAFAASFLIGLYQLFISMKNTGKKLFSLSILLLLFFTGLYLTPSAEGHAGLKADSFDQFYKAIITILGWPISSNQFFAGIFTFIDLPVLTGIFATTIIYFPAIIFSGYILWIRPATSDKRWFLLALIVWSVEQAFSIAYGRADSMLSSRYLDLFALGLLVNLACLLSLISVIPPVAARYIKTVICAWMSLVLISLGISTMTNAPSQLISRRDTGLIQETNVRDYLVTKNIQHLKDKPLFDIPYPDADRLIMILNSESIVNILPMNIRPAPRMLSVEMIPEKSFVMNGFYPTTPAPVGTAFGSYDHEGDANKGQVLIRYEKFSNSNRVLIPISGYPLNDGNVLELKQGSEYLPITVRDNPGEAWSNEVVTVVDGDFTIHAVDSSVSSWLAIATPKEIGRLDQWVDYYSTNSAAFIMIGFILIIISVINITVGRISVD